MLRSDLEIRKGILFIRLSGELTKKTLLNFKKIKSLIVNNELNNIVINISNIDNIDQIGINNLDLVNQICLKNNGKFLLCNHNKKIQDIIKNSVLKNIINTNSELEAFELIKI